jgi:hypothetical protein
MKDFVDIIKRRSEGYKGPHAEVIQSVPELYTLLNKLISRQALPPRQRVFALAVVGYFSIHDDVMSVHDFGADGYLDDAYLCCHVLRHYLDVLGAEDLYEYWGGETDLRHLLDEPYLALEADLGPRAESALNFAGLAAYMTGGIHE